MRLALGASRNRLVSHLMTESLMLSLGGGVAGALVAWWGLQWLLRLDLPIGVDVSLDGRVLAFASALSLVTGVAFGLAPALKATRVDLLSTLRDEETVPLSRRRLTLKNALIVFQVAISVLLLGVMTIFLQLASVTKALPVDFAVEGVAMIETDVRYAGHTGASARAVYDELLRRVAAMPGVEAATLLRGYPMDGSTTPIVVDGSGSSAGPTVEASQMSAGPGFFDTLRIPLLYGRAFDGRDRTDTPRVAVVSARMAQQYFGTVNAVGRRFRPAADQNGWIEVVGVARDTGTGDFSDDVMDPIPPVFYRTVTQLDALPTVLVARSSRGAAPLTTALQRELRALDGNLPVISTATMAQRLESFQTIPNTISLALGTLGSLGLLLAGTGLYAVVAFAVARRSREIGIRIALGAWSRHVAWSVARGIAGLVGVGTGIGLLLAVLAILAMRVTGGNTDAGIGNISVYRPDVDPLALAGIAVAMALVGMAAAFVPARRAARLDPLVALRRD